MILAVSIALCTNTKLNGLMLWPIFVVTNVFWTRKNNNWKKIIFDSTVVLLVTAILMILLNPYLHSDPLVRMGELFERRVMSAKTQAVMFPEVALNSPVDRLTRIGENFFMPEKMVFFNQVFGLKIGNWLLSTIMMIIFGIGLWGTFIGALKGNKHNLFMILMGGGVVIAAGGYLILDWERYYIQLVLPVVYFQLVGVKLLMLKYSKWFWKNRFKMWLIGGGTILGFLLVEIYLNIINYPLQNCKTISEASEYATGKFDSELGWGYKENTSYELGGVKYAFGENGQRVGMASNGVITGQTQNILVIGDSILFGHGIEASDTFSEKLQGRLGNKYHVMNFSVQGYGTDQIFLLMARLIPVYKPKVIITNYISDHDKRNVNQDRRYMFPCMKFSGTKPAFIVDNGNLKQTVFPKEYLDFDKFKIGLVWKRFGESNKLKNWSFQEELTRSLMTAMGDLAKVNEIKLLTINFDTSLTEYQRSLIEPLVVEVNNQGHKELYIDDGVHPNSKGTSIMLEKFLDKFEKLLY